MTWIISKRAKRVYGTVAPEIGSLYTENRIIGYSGGSVRSFGDMPQVPAIVVADKMDTLRIEVGKDDQGQPFVRTRGFSNSLDRLVRRAIAAGIEAKGKGLA